MKRAHWFTQLRVAFRIWWLRRAMRRQLEIYDCLDCPPDEDEVRGICRRYNAASAQLHALGVKP